MPLRGQDVAGRIDVHAGTRAGSWDRAAAIRLEQLMTDWVHAGTSILPAFLASLVEFVEALTVVLAIGIVRGWRSALAGTGLALAVLLVLVAVLGPALQNIPLDWIQLVIGVLLLLFGM